jgi:precorrin-6Y C5,15-methyltransferase (decarboxylating)
MNPVNIIGMGMGPQDLSEQQLKIIEQADVLVGGRRLLALFKASTAQRFSKHQRLRRNQSARTLKMSSTMSKIR